MYLSTDLITSIKARANVPTSQITFQTADFLRFADEEIKLKLVPLILKNLEEFYVRPFDYSITKGQAKYLIPTRAIAARLRDIEVVDSNDDENRTPLDRISREDLRGTYVGSNRMVLRKTGFYLEGNSVVLYPAPTATQNILRLSYYCRPSQLVDTTACAQVQSIDTVNKQITVVSLPSTISASTLVDFVKANPGFECSAIDQTITNVAGTILTFSAALPTDLAVGDYVCLANQSCVVQVPAELHPLLAQYVVVRVLAAQSDLNALKMAEEELKKLEENAQLLICPRVDGNPKRVINARAINRWV